MYHRDAIKIQRRAQKSAKVFARVGLFILCSIRVRFPMVADMVSRVDAGDDSVLYGWKRQAWRDHRDNAKARLAELNAIVAAHGGDPVAARDELLAHVCGWVGFGPAKGGFLLQMVYGVSACLDSRNIEAFEIDGQSVRSRKFKRRDTLLAYVRAYHQRVDALGGTAALWDVWCRGYAEQGSMVSRPDLVTASDFSREHSRIVLS